RNWKIMYIRARDAVDIELSQQITIDPSIVIVGTMEPGVDRISPYDSLKKVVKFLDDLKKLWDIDPKDWDPRLPELIIDTQKRIKLLSRHLELRSYGRSSQNAFECGQSRKRAAHRT